MRLRLTALFTRLSGGMPADDEAQRRAVFAGRLLLSVDLLLLLGYLISLRVVGNPRLFPLLAIGIFVGLMAAWSTAVRANADSSAATIVNWQNGALGVLVVLAGAMTAYLFLSGFGVALLMVAAWLSGGLACTFALDSARPANGAETTGKTAFVSAIFLLRLLLFGVVLVLYRLFVSRFADNLRGVGLSDYYALFGLIAGAILPSLYSGYLLRPSLAASMSPSSAILRLGITAALVLLAPALILILWGGKCALSLLMGAALAIALTESGAGLLPSLFALALALALTQWTEHVLPLASLSRDDKFHLLKVVVSSLVVLLLLADYGGRFNDWLKSRKESRPAPIPGGMAQ